MKQMARRRTFAEAEGEAERERGCGNCNVRAKAKADQRPRQSERKDRVRNAQRPSVRAGEKVDNKFSI